MPITEQEETITKELSKLRQAGVRRGINACRDILRAEYLLQAEAGNSQQFTVLELLKKLDSLTVEEAEG